MLVIFIDDLDRCGPSATAKIVETINVFFGQETDNCIFILGMHKNMVAASLELAYEKLTNHAKNDPALAEELPFGRRFLEKIVQFQVRIPEPDERDVERYLAHLTGAQPVDEVSFEEQAIIRSASKADKSVEEIFEEVTRRKPPVVAGSTNDTNVTPPEPSSEEKAQATKDKAIFERIEGEKRFQRAKQLDEKDPEVLRVFKTVQFALRKNPRQYVRFLNALRFANLLDSFDHRDREGTAADQILDLAKREVLALEWPELHAKLQAENVNFEEFLFKLRIRDSHPSQVHNYLTETLSLDLDPNVKKAQIDALMADDLLCGLANATLR